MRGQPAAEGLPVAEGEEAPQGRRALGMASSRTHGSTPPGHEGPLLGSKGLPRGLQLAEHAACSVFGPLLQCAFCRICIFTVSQIK